MTIFFTSDTHFGHANVIKYSSRPFSSIEEHDEALIQNWNSHVSPKDTIYHLGDFALTKPRSILSIVQRLQGNIHLILGNHDHELKRKAKLQQAFQSVDFYKEIKVGTQHVVLCHFPIESWNRRHYGAYHLHGHCHGGLPSPDWQARVDVGVDVWNYTPVSFEEIVQHMSTKSFKKIDHHQWKAR